LRHRFRFGSLAVHDDFSLVSSAETFLKELNEKKRLDSVATRLRAHLRFYEI
jgi:hypothetical protein